ncbi:hypothetical protein VTH06DRAFT_587 [Thermothelomyces fergusii]
MRTRKKKPSKKDKRAGRDSVTRERKGATNPFRTGGEGIGKTNSKTSPPKTAHSRTPVFQPFWDWVYCYSSLPLHDETMIEKLGRN